MSYTNIFGGSVVQPSDVMYIRLALTGNTTLSWPTQYVDSLSTPYVVARTTEITTNGAGYLIAMPAANQVSVGMDAMIRNVGSNPFIVTDNAGNQIIQIAAGLSWYIYVTDNSSVAGTWGIIQQGAGTSSADATNLAGNGLIPLNGELNTDIVTANIAANYNATVSDLAKLFYWTGGTGTFSLPQNNTIFNGFYLSVNNTLSGSLLTLQTVDGSSIDGSNGFQLNPGESSTFVWTGTQWCSLGYGKANIFGATINIQNIGGNSNITLSDTQASRSIQQYTGTLTGNIAVIFPNVLFQKIVNNQTTGSFSLTLKTAGMGATVVIPQGQIINIYCDGNNNIYSVPTILPSESLLFGDGSATNPSIAFASDTDTGFYHPGSGIVNFTSNGQNALSLTSNQLLPYIAGSAGIPTYSYFGQGTTGLYYNTGTSTQNITVGGSDTIRCGTNLTTFIPNTSLQGTLTVAQGTTLNSTLNVTGLSILSTVTITGAITLGSALTVSNGGTGQTNTVAAFNNLSPITTQGDVIIGTGPNAAGRLATGTAGQYFQANGPGVNPSWATFPAFGKILQVQQLVFSDTVNSMAGTATFNPIPSFTLNITPIATTSRIIILAQIYAATTGSYAGFNIGRNGTYTIFTSNARTGCDAYSAMLTSATLTSIPLMFVDSPNTTAAVTYSVGCAVVGGFTTLNYTLNQASGGMACSSLILMEIGA